MFGTYILELKIGALFTYFSVPSKYFFLVLRQGPALQVRRRQRAVPHRVPLGSRVIVVLGIALTYLYSVPGLLDLLHHGHGPRGAAYIVPRLAAAVFPFVKKDLFAQAPGWVAKKVGGVPLVTIIGLVVVVGFALRLRGGPTRILSSPSPARSSEELAAGLVVVGFVIYFVSSGLPEGPGDVRGPSAWR